MWADRSFVPDVQYKTDVNLTARQSIYAYQQPRPAREDHPRARWLADAGPEPL